MAAPRVLSLIGLSFLRLSTDDEDDNDNGDDDGRLLGSDYVADVIGFACALVATGMATVICSGPVPLVRVRTRPPPLYQASFFGKLLYFYCFALLRRAAQALSGGRPMGTGTSLVVVRHTHIPVLPPPFHRSISAKRVWVWVELCVQARAQP